MEFVSHPVQGPQKPAKRLSAGYLARRRRRIVKAAIGVVGLSSIAAAFVLVDSPVATRTSADAGVSAITAPTPRGVEPVVADEAPVRPIYRHSVVPGGVRSSEEIQNAIQRDEVVAAHYKGINPNLMRSVRLDKPLLAHVSYRIGDKVFWTKKPVQLPANEPVMTDGATMIRERCGNIISMEPLAPASDEEPPLPSFDLLVDPIEFPWQHLSYTPPALRTIGPRSVPPGSTPTQMTAPLPIPEPNTLILVGLGAVAAAAHALRRRRTR